MPWSGYLWRRWQSRWRYQLSDPSSESAENEYPFFSSGYRQGGAGDFRAAGLSCAKARKAIDTQGSGKLYRAKHAVRSKNVSRRSLLS